MHYNDFPEEKDFIFYFVFTASELFWSLVAFLIVLLSATQILFSKELRPLLHWVFFAFAGVGSMCLLSQSISALATISSNPYENSRIINARQFLVSLGSCLIDIAFTSMVLMLRQVHRMLRLKRKQTENIFLLVNAFQLIFCLGLSFFHAYGEHAYSLFATHVANFVFGCTNAIAYIVMYKRFRSYVLKTPEVSVEMTLNSAALCRNFGLFMTAYCLFILSYFWLAFGAFADIAGFYNNAMLFFTCMGAVTYSGTRCFALGLAAYLLHPPWATYLDSVYNPEFFSKKSIPATNPLGTSAAFGQSTLIQSSVFGKSSLMTSEALRKNSAIIVNLEENEACSDTVQPCLQSVISDKLNLFPSSSANV